MREIKIIPVITEEIQFDKSLFLLSNLEKLKETLNSEHFYKGHYNAFYVDTGINKVLFDTGLKQDNLLSALKNNNINPDDIEYVFLTHSHLDHIGGLIGEDNSKTFKNAKIFFNKKAFLKSNGYDKQTNEHLNKIKIAYKDNLKSFSNEKQIIPHITPMFAYGHTSDHTLYQIKKDNENLFIVGDLLHAHLQFANPDIYMTYDQEPEQAIQTRLDFLEKAANNNYLLAGAHFVKEGIVRILKTNDGYQTIYISD